MEPFTPIASTSDGRTPKARSSILKSNRTPFLDGETTDTIQMDPTSTMKRVSFSTCNFIKPFKADDERNTIWDKSYEEPVTESDASGSDSKRTETDESASKAEQSSQIIDTPSISGKHPKKKRRFIDIIANNPTSDVNSPISRSPCVKKLCTITSSSTVDFDTVSDISASMSTSKATHVTPLPSPGNLLQATKYNELMAVPVLSKESIEAGDSIKMSLTYDGLCVSGIDTDKEQIKATSDTPLPSPGDFLQSIDYNQSMPMSAPCKESIDNVDSMKMSLTCESLYVTTDKENATVDFLQSIDYNRSTDPVDNENIDRENSKPTDSRSMKDKTTASLDISKLNSSHMVINKKKSLEESLKCGNSVKLLNTTHDMSNKDSTNCDGKCDSMNLTDYDVTSMELTCVSDETDKKTDFQRIPVNEPVENVNPIKTSSINNRLSIMHNDADKENIKPAVNQSKLVSNSAVICQSILDPSKMISSNVLYKKEESLLCDSMELTCANGEKSFDNMDLSTIVSAPIIEPIEKIDSVKLSMSSKTSFVTCRETNTESMANRSNTTDLTFFTSRNSSLADPREHEKSNTSVESKVLIGEKSTLISECPSVNLSTEQKSEMKESSNQDMDISITRIDSSLDRQNLDFKENFISQNVKESESEPITIQSQLKEQEQCSVSKLSSVKNQNPLEPIEYSATKVSNTEQESILIESTTVDLSNDEKNQLPINFTELGEQIERITLDSQNTSKLNDFLMETTSNLYSTLDLCRTQSLIESSSVQNRAERNKRRITMGFPRPETNTSSPQHPELGNGNGSSFYMPLTPEDGETLPENLPSIQNTSEAVQLSFWNREDDQDIKDKSSISLKSADVSTSSFGSLAVSSSSDISIPALPPAIEMKPINLYEHITGLLNSIDMKKVKEQFRQTTELNRIVQLNNKRITNLLLNMRVKPIPIPEPDPELLQLKNVLVAEAEPELKPPTIYERIKEAEKGCEKLWNLIEDTSENPPEGIYKFSTLNGRVEFTVKSDRETGNVEEFHTKNTIKDNPAMRTHLLVKLFEDDMLPANVESKLGSKYDILSLLDVIALSLREFSGFYRELRFLMSYGCEMEPDFWTKFYVLSDNDDLMLWIEINVNLANVMNLSASDIRIESRLTQDNIEVQLKESILSNCRSGFDFTTEFRKLLKAIHTRLSQGEHPF